ncbi:GMP synthase [Nitratireductor sp. CAU 1489]|uniref:GMP synthase n=1 Tax=Nitratireductor arenosus TaxID=2682096 RepID=A0A844QNT3_9HYPH|nr:type 1 glutamine amidotransferase [Nitratireductor arenosus]MVA99610.1 GMP synthase [Nitratireductor arenosus]
MRVLVVQNFDQTGLGLVGRALDEAGAKVDCCRTFAGDPLPDGESGHDGLVVLGGAQSAVDDENHPYLPRLTRLMREFVIGDRAVLGICLGAQVLARAMGGRNLIGSATEFGWRQVERTRHGESDPVLRVVPPRFPIFEWHDDTFTLPPGALRLARNGAAENQAFRVGRAGYGIQFHFEADRALVRRWNADFRDHLAESQPDWPARFESEAARHGPEADAAGFALARAWVALV